MRRDWVGVVCDVLLPPLLTGAATGLAYAALGAVAAIVVFAGRRRDDVAAMSRRVKIGWAIVAVDVAAATAMVLLWHLWAQAAITACAAVSLVCTVRTMHRLERGRRR